MFTLISPKRPDRLWSPKSLLFNGYRISFPGMKWPEREFDHVPPFSARVKKIGSMPLPHMRSWREEGQIVRLPLTSC